MPFISTSLSVVAYANGFTLWNYQTEDKLEDVKKNGYFNDTAPFMRVGDRIMVTSIKVEEAQNSDVFISKVLNNEVCIKDVGIGEFQEIDADFIEKVLKKISTREENKLEKVKAPEAQPQTAVASELKKTA